MSNVNRVKRGFTEDPCCAVCGHIEESALHLLRDCREAQKLWNGFSFTRNDWFYSTGEIKEWVVANLSVKPREEIQNWPTTFAVVVWWLWRWRNCRVFNRQDAIPINCYGTVIERIREVVEAKDKQELISIGTTTRKKEITIRWMAPPVDWTMLNIDGASRGNPGLSGAGGLFRDSTGRVVLSFAEKLGIATVTRAEIMALRRGLMIAIERKIPRLFIQTDSKVIEGFMKRNEEDFYPTAHSHLIRICRSFLYDTEWEMEIIHVYREANFCADWLANHGVDQDVDFRIFEPINTPPQLRQLIDQDARGVAWPRSVPAELIA